MGRQTPIQILLNYKIDTRFAKEIKEDNGKEYQKISNTFHLKNVMHYVLPSPQRKKQHHWHSSTNLPGFQEKDGSTRWAVAKELQQLML